MSFAGECGRGVASRFALGLMLVCSAAWSAPAWPAARSRALTEETWAREVSRRGADPSSIPFPIAYTAEMQTLARSVAGGGGPLDRLRRLQTYLFDPDSFPFNYDSRQTLTATEAFAARSGNCVSFTNLFIALARSLGVPVRAALPTVRGDAEREGDLVVVNTHVVAVYERDSGFQVFDFSSRRERQAVGLRIIDDLWITAVYLNNLGATALMQGDPAEAARHLDTAVKLAPGFAPPYGNLGIVRRRLGDERGALEAYRLALEVAPGDATVMNNLAALYQAQGRAAEARAALKAADLKGATPFAMILHGDFALLEGRHEAALRLYRRAARLAPDLPEPQLAIGRAEIARGRPKAARKAVLRALEADPANPLALMMLDDLENHAPASSGNPAGSESAVRTGG